jgi:hypothetical protein
MKGLLFIVRIRLQIAYGVFAEKFPRETVLGDREFIGDLIVVEAPVAGD